MSIVRQCWNWYFSVPEGSRGFWRIVLWWELRRIPFNIVVLCFAVPSSILFMLSILYAGNLAPGEDAVEPMAVMFAPFAINIAYCAGAVSEITLKYLWRSKSTDVAPSLLKLGITFSILMSLLPGLLWGAIAVAKLYGIK